MRIIDDPNWPENVPEEDRFYYITQWGMPRSMEEEAKQMEERVAAEPLPPGITAEDIEKDKAAREREDVAGYSAALSPPWWPEAEFAWIHHVEEGFEHLRAPRIFTTKEAAEAVLRGFQDDETEAFMDLVDRHGFEETNEALDNTAPLRAMWLDRESLILRLEMADFLCVMVDDRLMLRRDFMEELGHPRG